MSRGKSTLEKRLPFLQTVRDYNLTYFRRDVQASLTVALLDVPQAIAYSLIAGLPPVYGLYTSIVTALVTSLLNSSSHVVSGPTNAVSIMIASTLASANVAGSGDDPVALVALLTLLVGLTQLAFGLLKVGNLAQFLSRSVLVGFTAGAGLLIAFKQLAPMLGLELEDEAKNVFTTCLENGVMINVTVGNVVRLAPPLTISEDELGKGLDVLISAMKA